jgi:hypothetical protein
MTILSSLFFSIKETLRLSLVEQGLLIDVDTVVGTPSESTFLTANKQLPVCVNVHTFTTQEFKSSGFDAAISIEPYKSESSMIGGLNKLYQKNKDTNGNVISGNSINVGGLRDITIKLNVRAKNRLAYDYACETILGVLGQNTQIPLRDYLQAPYEKTGDYFSVMYESELTSFDDSLDNRALNTAYIYCIKNVPMAWIVSQTETYAPLNRIDSKLETKTTIITKNFII